MATLASNPHDVLSLLAHHRPLQTYGICYVRQAWDTSRWWTRNRAAVGLISLYAPFVYAITDGSPHDTTELLRDLVDTGAFPDSFMVGVTPGAIGAFPKSRYEHANIIPFDKMVAVPYPGKITDPSVRVLTQRELPAMQALFKTDATAGAFFNASMLDTNAYVGKFEDGQLVAASGVHFVDGIERIGNIGNVITHPEYRGKGYGRTVVDACLKVLHRNAIELVGLNVRQSNEGAIALYTKLGFRKVGEQISGNMTRTAAVSG